MTNGCDTIPQEFAALLDRACEMISDLKEQIKARDEKINDLESEIEEIQRNAKE